MGAEDMNWRTRAMCQDLDPGEADAIFFPHTLSAAKEAKAICKVCPVAAECLTEAIENGQKDGVWGGLTERERFSLTAAAKFPNRPNPPTIHARCGTYSGVSRHRKLLEQFCDDCRDARNERESARRRRARAAAREAS